jgi:RHS repeat-associated protein
MGFWPVFAKTRPVTDAADEPPSQSVFSADTTITYQYDDADRLIKESRDASDDAEDETTDYTYIRTQQTGKTVKQGTVVQSQTTYSYDARGRMWGSTVTPYENGAPQTSQATTSTYKYDPDGVRFRQDLTVGSNPTAITKYLVDDDNYTGYAQVLEEKTTTSGVTETKTYTLGHDVVAQQTKTQTSGPTLTLLYDGHGSTRALLNASGAVATNTVNSTAWAQRFAYDAYGNLLGGTGLSSDQSVILTSLLYSGEQTDRATGLQYLRARYYDPSTGRFNRLDPIRERSLDPHSPISLHKYLYAGANPGTYVDPSGNVFSIPEFLGTMGNSAVKFGTGAYRAWQSFKTSKAALHLWRVTLAATTGVAEAIGNPDLTSGRMERRTARLIGFVAGFSGGLVTQYYDVRAGTAVTSLMRDSMNEAFDDRPFSWRSVAQISFNALVSTGVAATLHWYGRSTGEIAENITEDPKAFLQFFLEAVIQWEADTLATAASEIFIRYLEW